MPDKHLTKCSIFLVTREKQFKANLRFLFAPVRMAKLISQVTGHAVQNVEQEKHCSIFSGISNL